MAPPAREDARVQRSLGARRLEQHSPGSHRAPRSEPAPDLGAGRALPTVVTRPWVTAAQQVAGNAAVAQRLAGTATAQRQPAGPGASSTTASPASATAGSGQGGRVRIAATSSVPDAKNSVRDAMDRMKQSQIHAIAALERTSEIKDPPPPPDVVGQIILSVVTGAASAALGGLASRLASAITFRVAYYSRSATVEALFYENGATAKVINDLLAKQLESGVTAAYGRIAGSAGALGTSPQIAFFQRTKNLVEILGEDRKTRFNNEAARYDRLPADQALNELQVLKEAHDLVADREAANSESAIYLATLTQFATLLSELSLGRTAAGQHAPGEGAGADLTRLGGKGVLDLDLLVAAPGATPAIRSATVDGIPAELRAVLAGKPVGQLGMNVRLRGRVDGVGPDRTSAAFTISRNTGGTVDYGPRAAGQFGHVDTLNFLAHKAVPGDDRWLWARYSMTGGSYGMWQGGRRLSYHEPGLWTDDSDLRRQRAIDDAFEHFRGIAFTGARHVVEQDVFPLALPGTVGGRAG